MADQPRPSMPIREFVELGAKAQKAAKVLEEVAAKLKPLGYELVLKDGKLYIKNIEQPKGSDQS